MNDNDTAVLLSRRVYADEPPFTLDASRVIADGRRLRSAHRRRAALVAAGMVAGFGVVVGAVVGAGMNFFPDGSTERVDVTARVPANYDAEAIPHVLETAAEEHLGARLTGMDEEFAARSDNSTKDLAAGAYDQATSMELSYSSGQEIYVSVWVAHARGEAEGDPAAACRDLQSYSPEAVPQCETSRIGGATVVTQTTIHAPMAGTPTAALWDSLPLADAGAMATQGSDLYITRSVKVIRSETLVTSVREVVRARTISEAEGLFAWDFDALTRLATDARLVIPRP